jgi:cell division FtsZ-interacting protein ZapD
MNTENSNSPFCTKGTVPLKNNSYIERKADSELYNYLLKNDYCIVVAPRQSGKSSLLIRTRSKLNDQKNTICVYYDAQSLTISSCTEESLFQVILKAINEKLRYTDDVAELWKNKKEGDNPQTFRRIIIEDICSKSSKVIVLIDEIDKILNFSFSDDFFTAIRSLYNERAEHEILNNISFVFAGMVLPSELMKNKERTPYNIATEIKLEDFDEKELESFYETLGKQSEAYIKRVFYWSNGQPFLVQKICNKIYNLQKEEKPINDNSIDEIVKELFLDGNHEHTDSISNYLLSRKEYIIDFLNEYRKIFEGTQVKKETKIHDLLLISGIITNKNDVLKVRNRIYEQVFNKPWIENIKKELNRTFQANFDNWLEKNKKDAATALRGSKLKEAIIWAETNDASLLEWEYINFSQNIANKEKVKRIIIASISLITILFIVFSIYFYNQNLLLEQKSIQLKQLNKTIKYQRDSLDLVLKRVREIGELLNKEKSTSSKKDSLINVLNSKLGTTKPIPEIITVKNYAFLQFCKQLYSEDDPIGLNEETYVFLQSKKIDRTIIEIQNDYCDNLSDYKAIARRINNSKINRLVISTYFIKNNTISVTCKLIDLKYYTQILYFTVDGSLVNENSINRFFDSYKANLEKFIE